MTIDESWMREICTSSLTRGRDIARQARYAVFRHIRENPETRSTETYPYRCTLSTLPGFELELAGAERYWAEPAGARERYPLDCCRLRPAEGKECP